VAGCEWSYDARKDLDRHVLTHSVDRLKYYCPYVGCKYSETRLEKAFGRKDLRDRHKRNCRSRVVTDASRGAEKLVAIVV
jgi:hypothetical protein